MQNFKCIAIVLLISQLGLGYDIPPQGKPYQSLSVYFKPDGTITVDFNLDKYADAYGFYNNTIDENGWSFLEIGTSPDTTVTDAQKFYAVGYIEGYLTNTQIYQAAHNIMTWQTLNVIFSDSSKSAVLLDWLSTNEKLSRAQAAANDDDPFWQSIGNLWSQFDGLVAGSSNNSKASGVDPLPRYVFNVINSLGDTLDLSVALNLTTSKPWQEMTPVEFRASVLANSRCSALVRVTPGLEELYMGQSTWFIYQMMLRIYKTYHIRSDNLANQVMQFSSYAATLASTDDFYMMKDTRLVMLQTTNNIFNTSLYSQIQKEDQVAWLRVRTANQLARTGAEWAELFSKKNSGTYNNQYMLIDLNRVSLKNELQDGALTVVEQIPGLVAWGDQTDILQTGFWPSYNVPFYEEIYNQSGYPAVVEQFGLDYSYQMAPRAKIFRRQAPLVMSLDNMQGMMRYNEYKTDPYSEGNSCNSICCREDSGFDGCYDSKVTSFTRFSQGFLADIISGPTTYDNLPAFSWGNFPNTTAGHLGQPTTFDFDYVTFSPVL